MKNLTTLICVLVACFLCSCKQGSVDVKNDIRNANTKFMDAFSKGDAIALAKNYTSNAKLFPSNSDVIEGQKSIQGFWDAVLKMGIKKAELETISAEAVGDLAVEEGRYKLFVDGDVVADQGKYIVTWHKENGEWKLHHDIWNTSNAAPQPRAAANDTVWVIFNHVKADMVKQFEHFNFNLLEPAASEFYPKMKNTVRTLRPVGQNPDKTYTYVYLMDAATSPDGYDMMLPLTAKYGEQKAKEYLKMFESCLKDGKQVAVVTTQTSW